jgi:hypothetical protein
VACKRVSRKLSFIFAGICDACFQEILWEFSFSEAAQKIRIVLS